MSRKVIAFHKKLKGKIYIESKIPKITDENLQLIYTPGVATVCKEISSNPESKYELTSKGNNVAVITDGTRILGLGNIGPDAAKTSPCCCRQEHTKYWIEMFCRNFLS